MKHILASIYPSNKQIRLKPDDISTISRKAISNSKNNNKKTYKMKTINHSSILDSIQLFDPSSISSQVWSFTHK
jgi:hypothetical protein